MSSLNIRISSEVSVSEREFFGRNEVLARIPEREQKAESAGSS